MKKQITLFAVCFIAGLLTVNAQTNTFPATGSVGIGTITPNASALLEMSSTSKGLLAPRMTKSQRDAIASPATGLLIFQTNSSPGFYYYTGASWTAIASKGANTTLSNLTTTSISQPLLPNADNTVDLGSSTLRWNELYVNNIKFLDGTTQTTAGGGGATYTAGTGISIAGSVISNTGDVNAADDLTILTNHGGDVTGVYNNLQISTGAVGSAEIADGSVTSTDILNGTIAAADLSSMGATSGQVMQWNGIAWIATTPAAGAETDPQVGTISTNAIPRWDGTALTTGGIVDDGDNLSFGWNNGISSNTTASFYNNEGVIADEDIAIKGVDQTVSLGGTATVHSTGYLGYNTVGVVFGDTPVSHVGVWGNASTTTNSAAVYANNSSTGSDNYGVVAKSVGAGTTNIGLYARSAGATNNYGVIVPTDGGKSGFNWSSPSALVGIKGNDTDNALRIIGTDFNTDLIVDEVGRVGVHGDPDAFSANFNVYGSGYVQDRLNIGVSGAFLYSMLAVNGTDETVTIMGTNPYIQMKNAGSNVGYLRANGSDLMLATNSGVTGKVILRANGINSMYVDQNGNIVMGSTTVAPKSGYKLSVDGKVVCEELLVQLSPWPDYVFADDYKLSSLSEVENFINENNRLPGIPSAAEVESEGLNVGQMQKLMMEKIEELTLYMIELQKQNADLQAKVDALSN
ncbi:MAG TPA: hypothetical protein PKK72_10500 [Chitinophagales bacterium]|nr:hypothetical protein [Chitinophagales bacterium]HNM09008.1 hypothetical protein [Chitinophagales bacterium]